MTNPFDEFAKTIMGLVDNLYIDTMDSEHLNMFARMFADDDGLTREQLALRLHLEPPAFGSVGHMNAVVDSEPALWHWRMVGRAHVKIVQSWENRPTQSQWRELKRWIRREIMPAGVLVEFRGCPRLVREG